MNGIVINEDNSHYFLSRGIDGADLPELKELTAHYCVGQVSEVVYNFMAQRANVAGLNADPIWHGVEDKGEKGLFFRGRTVRDGAQTRGGCAVFSGSPSGMGRGDR